LFIGNNAKLIDRHDKVTGWTYILSNKTTNNRFQIIRSASKHTNSIVAFLSWMLNNAKQFVDYLSFPERMKFFLALRQLAKST